MPKAVTVIQGVSANSTGALIINYTVSVDKQDGSGDNWSADAPAGVGLTLAQWKTAAINKVIADCANRGIIVTSGDVVIVAGPMA